MRKIEVFTYGLFMEEAYLRSLGLRPENIRRATLEGFELRLGLRATLYPAAGKHVLGLVMSLSHRELEELYSDPSLHVYRPEAVAAKLADGTIVAALCFNLPGLPPPEERNPEYAAELRTLATSLGFPADYVAAIQ